VNDRFAINFWNSRFGGVRRVSVEGYELSTRTITSAKMVNGTAMIFLADLPHTGPVPLSKIRPAPLDEWRF
jgi:hypothetical protein